MLGVEASLTAPRSIMPCCISSMIGVLFASPPTCAYTLACCFSVEHDVKPNSMPPRVRLSGSLCFIWLGSVRKEMPR